MQADHTNKNTFAAFMEQRAAVLSSLANRNEAGVRQQAWNDFQSSVYLYETDPIQVRKAAHKAYHETSPVHCTQEEFCHWYCAEADLIQQAASQKSSSKSLTIGLCASILAVVIWLIFFAP